MLFHFESDNDFAVTLSIIYVTAPKCDGSWDTLGEKDGAGAHRFIAYKSHSALRIKIKPCVT
jgi:hypothetical protein